VVVDKGSACGNAVVEGATIGMQKKKKKKKKEKLLSVSIQVRNVRK